MSAPPVRDRRRGWRCRVAADGRADGGMTLVELLVAMSVFTVVLAIAMSAVVSMTRGTAVAAQLADAQQGTRTAFQRLDHQVRYAEAVNRPGAGPSGAVYVEWRTGAVSTPTGTAQCTQWRYDPTARTLARRSWPDVTAPTVQDWQVMVTDVLRPASAPATYPFVVAPATETRRRQTLTLTLLVGPGENGARVTTSSVFAARNSSTGSVSNADADGNGASDLPVCLSLVGRP
ncbi:PulJ/GspJ family protein [Cellulomonas endophytica]|uniref:PulJ/GspJ family protein n=1 Tax=Cellulomonas endophytica TaxID=2494735 RepID=UPI0010118EA9|nr:type II secretion system protein [Cellulomonas endophytica]